MPTIDLPHGTVHYRVAGPDKAEAAPVVFVHGFLVNATLWTGTADALAVAGVRSYAADWPLGSHTIALGADVDQSPRGVARQITAFIEALELDNVTLVGNDTGGAICQFLLDGDASRIGRVVLTNCDAFTNFPPAPFGQLFRAFRSPRAIRVLMAPMRATAVRHSPAGFGLLVANPSTPTRRGRGWSRASATPPSAETSPASPGRWTLRISTSRQCALAASTAQRYWCGDPRTASSSSTTPAGYATPSLTPGSLRSRTAEGSYPTTSRRAWPTRSPHSNPPERPRRLLGNRRPARSPTPAPGSEKKVLRR